MCSFIERTNDRKNNKKKLQAYIVQLHCKSRKINLKDAVPCFCICCIVNAKYFNFINMRMYCIQKYLWKQKPTSATSSQYIKPIENVAHCIYNYFVLLLLLLLLQCKSSFSLSLIQPAFHHHYSVCLAPVSFELSSNPLRAFLFYLLDSACDAEILCKEICNTKISYVVF